jgi:hypothetical protein
MHPEPLEAYGRPGSREGSKQFVQGGEMNAYQDRPHHRRQAKRSAAAWLIVLWAGLSLFACSSSATGPSNPVPNTPAVQVQYHAKIEVTYVRDPSKILDPDATYVPGFTYQLYDPDQRLKTSTDQRLVDGYRIGLVYMEQTGEHTYRGYLEQVPIHSASVTTKHKIHVHDVMLYDGTDHTTAYTPDGITVQYGYDYEIIGWERLFKISSQ